MSAMYSNDPQVDQDAKSKFFVANMKYEFTEEEVTEWFSVSKLDKTVTLQNPFLTIL